MPSYRLAFGAVGLCVIAMVASGCGAGSARLDAETARARPSHTGVIYHGTDTATLNLNPSLGFVLHPPAAGVAPPITWQEAYSMCERGSPCGSQGGPDIYLTRLTETNSNLAIQPGGSTIPDIDNRLVYIMVWYGQPCPAPAGPVPALPSQDAQCTMHAIVDANTAADLGGGSGPP